MKRLIVYLLTISLIAATSSCSATFKLKRLRRENPSTIVNLAGTSPLHSDAEDCDTTLRESSDTLTVIDPQGNRVFFMKATVDSTGTLIASEELQPAIVTAKFRNVPERNGMVSLDFDLEIPDIMLDNNWQIRLSPVLIIGEDTTSLERILITGEEYRKDLLEGYNKYNRYLNRIITDSSKLIYTELMETFLSRKEYYSISHDKVVEHYSKKGAIYWNNYLIKNKEKKYREYVKDTLATLGIRLDSVITNDKTGIKYCYSQGLKARRDLKRIDLIVFGEIVDFNQNLLFSIPPSSPITYYISSFSSMTEEIEKYLTKVIERKAFLNTSSLIEFRKGKYDVEYGFGNNSYELERIKGILEELMFDSEYNIDSITVTASSSPEGDYARNRELSRRRGEEITKYLEIYSDSLRVQNQGVIINLDETDEYDRDFIHFKFNPRYIAENWEELESMIRRDTLILKDKERLLDICSIKDVKERKSRLRRHEEYRKLLVNFYPELRRVVFDFHLHKKGMIKDTIHTTVIDTTYMKGLKALKERDYETAVRLLGQYGDINSALAFISLDYNASALNILERLPESAKRDYLLCIVYSRMGNERSSIEYYLKAKEMDPSLRFRANLDPEIGKLINKYGL